MNNYGIRFADVIWILIYVNITRWKINLPRIQIRARRAQRNCQLLIIHCQLLLVFAAEICEMNNYGIRFADVIWIMIYVNITRWKSDLPRIQIRARRAHRNYPLCIIHCQLLLVFAAELCEFRCAVYCVKRVDNACKALSYFT